MTTVPGYLCPFCGADNSPLGGAHCPHLFFIDGEQAPNFSPPAQTLSDAAAQTGNPTLFRDLLYHGLPRALLTRRVADYGGDVEVYFYAEHPEAVIGSFHTAIAQERE